MCFLGCGLGWCWESHQRDAFSHVPAMFSPRVRILACCLLWIIKMSSRNCASVIKNDAVQSKLEQCYWWLFKPYHREAAGGKNGMESRSRTISIRTGPISGRTFATTKWRWQQPSNDDNNQVTMTATKWRWRSTYQAHVPALSGCQGSHGSCFTSRSQQR